MTKKFSLALTALVLFAMLAGSALAATQDITVSANVVGTCKFDGSSINALNLGNLTSGDGLTPSISGDLNFWCTKNSAYTLTHNSTGFLTGTGFGDTIAYSFALSSVAGTGDGPSAPLDTTEASASIALGAYDDVSEDVYEEVVTVTLNP